MELETRAHMCSIEFRGMITRTDNYVFWESRVSICTLLLVLSPRALAALALCSVSFKATLTVPANRSNQKTLILNQIQSWILIRTIRVIIQITPHSKSSLILDSALGACHPQMP